MLAKEKGYPMDIVDELSRSCREVAVVGSAHLVPLERPSYCVATGRHYPTSLRHAESLAAVHWAAVLVTVWTKPQRRGGTLPAISGSVAVAGSRSRTAV